MEVEVVVATALTMKKAVVFLHMMLKLGFDESFGSVPLYIDNTSALHIAGNPTYSARAKHIALRYSFFLQELVGNGNISIHYVNAVNQVADLGTKNLSLHRHPTSSTSSTRV